jgi:hypothetical protein
MENPCLTFVTPTLLAGDKSLADVVGPSATSLSLFLFSLSLFLSLSCLSLSLLSLSLSCLSLFARSLVSPYRAHTSLF